MARAIWKAFIQFGPVSVPVKLYTAVRDVRPHSHLLHDHDRQRLQQRMVCSKEETTVGREETVKGYEVSENEYVVVEPHEMDALEPEPSREIEVAEFVEAGQVAPKYLDRTFFLGPEDDEQMYVNLAESLRQTKLAGMCRWVMRDKSYVGVLQQRDGLLSLTTHRYADEVVPEDSLTIKQVEPSKKEVANTDDIRPKQVKPQAARVGAITAAMQQLKSDYNPAKYVDEHRERVIGYLQEKAKQRGTVEVAAPEAAEQQAVEQEQGRDLVAALEESLARARAR